MGLNLLQDSTFPVHPSENKLFAGICDLRNFNWELGNSHDYRKEKNTDMSVDIIDLLPSDPFGMDIASTFTAITGWIKDIEEFGFNSVEFGSDETEVERGDDRLLAGLHLVWSNAMGFHPVVNDMETDSNSVTSDLDKELRYELFDDSFAFNGDVEDFMSFSCEKYCMLGEATSDHEGCRTVYSDGEATVPDALFFALGYLSVRDLLSVERVCKSLRNAVQNDPLLWRNIHIDQPLSNRITDGALLTLASRAQGGLRSLSLVECLKITNSGLKSVLESNPWLKKLSVPGCVRLNGEGILHNLKVSKSTGRPGITHLRIGGISGITHKHFEELKLLVGTGNQKKHSASKPRFYGGGQLYLSFDDDRTLDIETCPMCQRLAEVYDCPADNCKVKGLQLCRACTLCIARCINCGCCIDGREYEETFCLDFLCFDCLKQR